MTRTAILAAAAACLFGTTAVGAPIKAPVIVEEVTYADLNLGSRAGRAALERRIRVAAARVCAKFDLGSDAISRSVQRPCYLDAVESGRQQMRQVIAKRRGAQAEISIRQAAQRD
jgi:UrcA family protein